MDDIVELAVIKIEALSHLHDLGVWVDLVDVVDCLIFDDRIHGCKPGAGRAVAKKLIMANKEKVFLSLWKKLFHDEVVPLKVGARHLGDAVVNSVIEGD